MSNKIMLIELLPNEKVLLRFLYDENKANPNTKVNLNKCDISDMYVCCKRLKELGFIYAWFSGNIVIDAKIKERGISYIERNPTLENPVNENEIKKLQLKELEYKDRIRGLETTVLIWKFISAILGIIILFLSVFIYFIK